MAKQHPSGRFNFSVPADHRELTSPAKPPRVLWCPKPFGGPVDQAVLDALRGPLDEADKAKAIVLTEAKAPLLSADETAKLWEAFIAFAGAGDGPYSPPAVRRIG